MMRNIALLCCLLIVVVLGAEDPARRREAQTKSFDVTPIQELEQLDLDSVPQEWRTLIDGLQVICELGAVAMKHLEAVASLKEEAPKVAMQCPGKIELVLNATVSLARVALELRDFAEKNATVAINNLWQQTAEGQRGLEEVSTKILALSREAESPELKKELRKVRSLIKQQLELLKDIERKLAEKKDLIAKESKEEAIAKADALANAALEAEMKSESRRERMLHEKLTAVERQRLESRKLEEEERTARRHRLALNRRKSLLPKASDAYRRMPDAHKIIPLATFMEKEKARETKASKGTLLAGEFLSKGVDSEPTALSEKDFKPEKVDEDVPDLTGLRGASFFIPQAMVRNLQPQEKDRLMHLSDPDQTLDTVAYQALTRPKRKDLEKINELIDEETRAKLKL